MDINKTIVSNFNSKYSLKLIIGKNTGEIFELNSTISFIGRDEDSHICLKDPQCSFRHAQILREDDQFKINDLQSTNGTYLNDVRINQISVINLGDIIRVGESSLEFQLMLVPDIVSEVPVPEPDIVIKDPNSPYDVIPSRKVLNNAIESNKKLGHENLGFLSEEHGFLPTVPPLLDLPPMFREWDEISRKMPDLFRDLTLRDTFDSMPILSASEENLPDRYLLRASALMGIFGYSYFRVQPEPPEKIADSITRPWQEISDRLNRKDLVLSYIDLIIYNWKLKNPSIDNPIQVENMELLFPTVDNVVEQIFYLGQVEILSQLTPVVGAIVRAQEAVNNNDVESLKRELITITTALHTTTYDSLTKIKINPYAQPYFLDTVVWAKTVGPLAVSIKEGVPGPSGIASPIFHLLDEFLGRTSYDTPLGKEMTFIRDWYPPHWQEFLISVGKISVAEFVSKNRNKTLKGIYQNTTQAYVGETGFLGRHRLKAYGFLETAFKVGRSVTIGNFSGKFEDRAWDLVHTEMNDSRLERDRSFPQFYHHATIEEINTLSESKSEWVKQIELNVLGTGVHYQPGDRCAILPENSTSLVEKMLKVLRARGNEPMQLSLAWQKAIKYRKGYENTKVLPLRTLLTFGRIRPIDRATAKILYVITHSEKINQIVEARAEDQWELWDLLKIVRETGFDMRRLWKAHKGEKESIVRIVMPESFRMYSISSVMEKEETIKGAKKLHLTVGRLKYETKESKVSAKEERYGTSSNYLTDTSEIAAEDMGPVSFQIIHPPRFSLPNDPSTPIVMIAGGTGISPFRSFIIERAKIKDGGENWLLLGTRTSNEILYKEELEEAMKAGNLNVRIALSREKVDFDFSKQKGSDKFEFVEGKAKYIGEEMLTEENAAALWELIRSKEDGGKGAYIYVCGKTNFANSVMDAFETIMHKFIDGPEKDKKQKVNQLLYRMVAEERYLQEIFTTYTGAHADNKKSFAASEVALHNDDINGYWMIIDGRVYDVTKFSHIHPGGLKIIHEYTGMDATQAYEKILHHTNPEVNSMLGMYEIGVIRRLKFGKAWGVLIGPNGLEAMTLASAYRIWMRYLYFVIELENSLKNEYTIKNQPTTRNESPHNLSPYKIQLLLQIQERFNAEYIASVMGEPLKNIWAITSGMCAPNENIKWISDAIGTVEQSNEMLEINKLNEELNLSIKNIIKQYSGSGSENLVQTKPYFDVLETASKKFMLELRLAILDGIRVFEELEEDVLTKGNDRLLKSIKSIPEVLQRYYLELLQNLNALDKF